VGQKKKLNFVDRCRINEIQVKEKN